MIATIGNNSEDYGLQHRLGGMVILSLAIHLCFLSFLLLRPGLKKIDIISSPVISVDIVSFPKKAATPVSSSTFQEVEVKKPILEEKIKARKLKDGKKHEKKMILSKDSKLEKKKLARKEDTLTSDNKDNNTNELDKKIEKIRQDLLARAQTTKDSESEKAEGGIGYSKQGVFKGTTDLRFQIYYGMIWSKIKDSWVLPENTSDRKAEEAIIAIRIRKDGEIVDVRTEKSSGNSYFDQSALRAIYKANPLPPVPDGYKEEFFELGIRFFPSGP